MAKPKKPPVDYVAKISAMGWPELEKLWAKMSAVPKPKKIAGWASGKALEHLVLRAFELSGADVAWPYSVYMHGQVVEQIDGMIVADGIISLIEAKDQALSVNIEPLAKLRNQLLRRPAGVIGSVFSTSGFTEPAVTLANFMAPQAVLLWEATEVSHLIAGKNFVDGLKWKHRYLMQHGKPDYSVIAGAPK